MPKGLYNYEGVKDAEVKKPSKQWVKDFMKNHPELSDRTPMALAGITVKNFSNPWTLAGTQILQV